MIGDPVVLSGLTLIVNVLIIINSALIKRLVGLFVKFLAYILHKLT